MRILVTGGKGMLGRTLSRQLAPQHEMSVADLPETDILQSASLDAAFRAFRPETVIHCAAMTKVDDCESNEELAFRLNGMGSANVARACREHGARLIAISTDYVFDGRREEGDYAETDFPRPQTVYGKSKLAGERSALDILPGTTILRIAWLYGAGGPSFVHTMAKLGMQDGAPLKVVNLTVELFRLLGLKRPVTPCTTAEFPRPAPRPANSALAKTVLAAHGYAMPRWQDALAAFVSAEFS